jgi:hypothetical protein
MNDDDFKQEVLDLFGDSAQRHRSIMAILAEVKAQNDAILTELANLTTETHKALADYTALCGAGHAAILDGIVADQTNLLTVIKNTSGEIKSAIAAVPMPGQTPVPQ